METYFQSNKALQHLYKNTHLLQHINSPKKKNVLEINPFIFVGIKTFSSVARGQICSINQIPSRAQHAFPFTHTHTHTPTHSQEKKDTLKKHIGDMWLEKHSQMRIRRPPAEIRYEFHLYLAERMPAMRAEICAYHILSLCSSDTDHTGRQTLID